jgi:uncharacterized membrane protein YjdF
VTEVAAADLATRVNRWMVIVTTTIMGIDCALLLLNRQWLPALLVLVIASIVLAPTILRQRLPVVIPAEFQILALAFMFSSLFLGEVRGYYENIWWWDILLHASSGLLLGLMGFLLVYVLNENERAHLNMRPRFIAMFAFLFAVAVGAVWEIFEYSMDTFLGTTMQKPMLGDDSGLTDTMWDLIVDTLGALVISTLGWWYLHRGQRSFIEVWIRKFIERNPGMFDQV